MRNFKAIVIFCVFMIGFTTMAQALNMQDAMIKDIWNQSSNSMQISLVGSTDGWDVSEETALTATVHPLVTFTHTTSGTPANGIGLSLDWYQETTSANTELGARTVVKVSDVTAASEDFEIDWMLMTAGATAATVMNLGSTGVLTLVNAATIDNSVNGTLTITEPIVAVTGNVTVSGSLDVVGAGGLIMENDETITNSTNGQIDLNGDVYLAGAIKYEQCTIPDGDLTPDVAGCHILTTSANTGATAITDLDNPIVGSIVILVGGSATNSSTIADAGNFALSAAWTASVDETLTLYVQADNDYIELTRSTN